MRCFFVAAVVKNSFEIFSIKNSGSNFLHPHNVVVDVVDVVDVVVVVVVDVVDVDVVVVVDVVDFDVAEAPPSFKKTQSFLGLKKKIVTGSNLRQKT